MSKIQNQTKICLISLCTFSNLLFGDSRDLDEDPVPGREVEVGRSGDDEVGHLGRQDEGLGVKVAICSNCVNLFNGTDKIFTLIGSKLLESQVIKPVNSNVG